MNSTFPRPLCPLTFSSYQYASSFCASLHTSDFYILDFFCFIFLLVFFVHVFTTSSFSHAFASSQFASFSCCAQVELTFVLLPIFCFPRSNSSGYYQHFSRLACNRWGGMQITNYFSITHIQQPHLAFLW